MKDAFSENDRRSLLGTDGASPQTQAELQQVPTGNLTELAQLLAASIAQAQARGHTGGIPTNSELTNLAKLVTAASSQRTLAPVFNDGLSSLAYKQAGPRAVPVIAPVPSLELGQDDEPMPIPSTWREPSSHDEDHWLRQQMGAAVLGLAAGLMIVVPTVLWLSGTFDSKTKTPTVSRVAAVSPQVKASPTAADEVRPADVQTRPSERSAESPAQSAQQYMTGSVEPKIQAAAAQSSDASPKASARPEASPRPSVATTARLVEPKPGLEELLAEAARRVDSGDVAGARELLAGADDGTQGPVALALGETYDPNMLAAWGSRGIAADVAKARSLYRKALSLGVGRAQIRLDALK
jgi:hypothetical protein